MMRLAVVGTGLIGTSVALAARSAGLEVRLVDRDGDAISAAVARGAGEPWSESDPPADLALIAVPPAATGSVLRTAQRQRLAAVYTDVASTKAGVVKSARLAGCDMSSYVPGHPMAGGERQGPAHARANLFDGAKWVLCPQEDTTDDAISEVRRLVKMCGAQVVEMDAVAHDTAVAQVSHAPHVVASVVATAFLTCSPEVVALAGNGLRDTTRIAAGDPALWADILTQNAGPVADMVSAIAAELTDAARVLVKVADGGKAEREELEELLSRGCAGRARLFH